MRAYDPQAANRPPDFAVTHKTRLFFSTICSGTDPRPEDKVHETAGSFRCRRAGRRGRSGSGARTAIPMVGYLSYGSPESDAPRLTGLRRGLNEIGYVEGRNFVIEYRWAGNQAERLPALVADLVQLQVTVIVAAGVPPAIAAKAATTSIPVVFNVAADPVQLGLVSSLNRPGGNLTGINGFSG